MFVPKLKAWQAAVRPVGVPNLKAFARPRQLKKTGTLALSYQRARNDDMRIALALQGGGVTPIQAHGRRDLAE